MPSVQIALMFILYSVSFECLPVGRSCFLYVLALVLNASQYIWCHQIADVVGSEKIHYQRGRLYSYFNINKNQKFKQILTMVSNE